MKEKTFREKVLDSYIYKLAIVEAKRRKIKDPNQADILEIMIDIVNKAGRKDEKLKKDIFKKSISGQNNES